MVGNQIANLIFSLFIVQNVNFKSPNEVCKPFFICTLDENLSKNA
jgi:hypothetical protein